VIDYHACNSCWNDTNIQFDHHDFMWCPRHAGTERQFECTRLITPRQVITAISRLMQDHRLKPMKTDAASTTQAGAACKSTLPDAEHRILKCA